MQKHKVGLLKEINCISEGDTEGEMNNVGFGIMMCQKARKNTGHREDVDSKAREVGKQKGVGRSSRPFWVNVIIVVGVFLKVDVNTHFIFLIYH